VPDAKYLVIVNPAARHGESAKLIPVIRQLFRPVGCCDIVESTEPLHAKALAEAAVGYDIVVAAGGDGTVHEVLGGLMAHAEGTRPALAVLPTGSGNDYRRTLGISTDLAQAAEQILTGARHKVDVGMANGVPFANSIAMGFDARVTAKAVEYKTTTRLSGLPLYGAALFHVLFKEFYSHRLRIQLDDGPVEQRDLLLVAVTNGPTYGGGFRITPKARPDDGELDVLAIDSLTLGGALVRLPFVVTGHHSWMRHVHLTRQQRVRVWSEVPLPGQIDGEVTIADHYDVRILPAALDVVMPRR